MSTPPKRPEEPSAVPPPAPRDSDKAPDEIIALGPQKENCTRLHFPLSSNARALDTEAGERELRGSIQFQSQGGQRLRGTLGSCLPVHAHFSLASLGRGLGESGSRFTSSQVSWGHRSQWPCSVGSKCLIQTLGPASPTPQTADRLA